MLSAGTQTRVHERQIQRHDFAHDLWQRVFKQVRQEYPGIESRHLYIDTLAMELVRDPCQFDVIVTCNLFGDIISDLGAQLAGGLGLAPSGNIHPGNTSYLNPSTAPLPTLRERESPIRLARCWLPR